MPTNRNTVTGQPNVVVLVLDTFRAKELRSMDALSSLSALQRSGTTFENAYSAAPWTLPSHAALFTGTYSSKHGAHAGHKYLADGPTTLAEALRDGGYETAAVSNNTWISEEFGFGRGFDTVYKTWQYVQSDTDLGEIARTKEGTEKIRALAAKLAEGNPVVNVANTVYGTFVRDRADDDGARRTNEWIDGWLAERDGSSPFFLFVNYLEPHLEYRPPKRHADRFLPADVTYEEAMDIPQNAWKFIAGREEMIDRDFRVLRALYRAEIAYLDERIGDLCESLRAADEWDDTVFVVTGDHGENIGEHGLMDHQYCLYDTLLHVPLVIRGGPFDDGEAVDDLVQLTDLAPTLLDVADVDAPEFRAQAQGRSFHPARDSPPREYAIAEYLAPQPSLEALEKRVGELPTDVDEYDRALRSIRTKEYKLIRGSDGSRELYRVADDPGEQRNLVDQRRDVAVELEDELDDWLDSFEHAEASGSVSMSASTKDRLEDLGYLQ